MDSLFYADARIRDFAVLPVEFPKGIRIHVVDHVIMKIDLVGSTRRRAVGPR